MQIVLDYDPDTGQISSDGTPLFSWYGLQNKDIKNFKKTDILIELKKSGFLVDDILKLKREGLI